MDSGIWLRGKEEELRQGGPWGHRSEQRKQKKLIRADPKAIARAERKG